MLLYWCKLTSLIWKFLPICSSSPDTHIYKWIHHCTYVEGWIKAHHTNVVMYNNNHNTTNVYTQPYPLYNGCWFCVCYQKGELFQESQFSPQVASSTACNCKSTNSIVTVTLTLYTGINFMIHLSACYMLSNKTNREILMAAHNTNSKQVFLMCWREGKKRETYTREF
jgi:hypothetical protein